MMGVAILGALTLWGCGNSNASSPTSASSASAPTAGQYVAFVGELKKMTGETLNVGRDVVEANASTLVFRNNLQINVGQLRVGETVRVKGWYNDNATAVVARQIIVESEG